MNVRFRFKDWAKAQAMVSKLPFDCKHRVVKDQTTDIYIEVDEEWEDYIERYLYKPYREQ